MNGFFEQKTTPKFESFLKSESVAEPITTAEVPYPIPFRDPGLDILLTKPENVSYWQRLKYNQGPRGTGRSGSARFKTRMTSTVIGDRLGLHHWQTGEHNSHYFHIYGTFSGKVTISGYDVPFAGYQRELSEMDLRRLFSTPVTWTETETIEVNYEAKVPDRVFAPIPWLATFSNCVLYITIPLPESWHDPKLKYVNPTPRMELIDTDELWERRWKLRESPKLRFLRRESHGVTPYSIQKRMQNAMVIVVWVPGKVFNPIPEWYCEKKRLDVENPVEYFRVFDPDAYWYALPKMNMAKGYRHNTPRSR